MPLRYVIDGFEISACANSMYQAFLLPILKRLGTRPIACIRPEELVLQDLLPLSCWVLTDNRLRQQQKGHRLQRQVESET